MYIRTDGLLDSFLNQGASLSVGDPFVVHCPNNSYVTGLSAIAGCTGFSSLRVGCTLSSAPALWAVVCQAARCSLHAVDGREAWQPSPADQRLLAIPAGWLTERTERHRGRFLDIGSCSPVPEPMIAVRCHARVLEDCAAGAGHMLHVDSLCVQLYCSACASGLTGLGGPNSDDGDKYDNQGSQVRQACQLMLPSLAHQSMHW